MSANVGLSTPRGSGTSGYVQRNHAHLRPRDKVQPYPKEIDQLKHRQRQPDKQIIAHERARETEVKVFDLRDKLEEEGIEEDEIESQCEALRKKLTAQAEGAGGPTGKSLKKHQVHEMAAAKIQESERLRRALGISKDYEEGGHWKRQEERLKESVRRQTEAEETERGQQREAMDTEAHRSNYENRSMSRSMSYSRSPSRKEGRSRSRSLSRSITRSLSRSMSRSRSRSRSVSIPRSPSRPRGRPRLRSRSRTRTRSLSKSLSRSRSYSSRSYSSRGSDRNRRSHYMRQAQEKNPRRDERSNDDRDETGRPTQQRYRVERSREDRFRGERYRGKDRSRTRSRSPR